MNIIIDIGHPAHVHLFRFFAKEMTLRGHSVLFTVRDKEHEIHLLGKFGFRYKVIGRHYKSSSGKVLGLLGSVYKMLKEANHYKPDIYLSHGSIIAAQASWLSRKPHISLEDTGNAEQVRLYLPFTDAVITSNAFHRDYGEKQIRYNGFHELAYLHPRYFVADNNFRELIKMGKNEKLIIIRFVSWSATHDKGITGLSDNEKIKLVTEISSLGKVFISSESGIPEYIASYLYPFPAETMHQALAAADLYVGEGATMASECSVLGTPAIYINPQEAGTISEQAEYDLIFQYKNYQGALEKIKEIISMRDSREVFQARRNALIRDKIDLTGFLIWFVTNWPGSFKIMKSNPDYQKRFS
jgi:predicted glycosyltransferase